MKRIKDGFRLVGQSWQVVRKEPALIAVMGAGLVAMLLVAALLFLVIFRRMPEGDDFRFPGFLWIYPIFVIAGLPVTIAGSTVVATAMQTMKGRDASVRDGLALTMRRLPALVGWSLLSGVVGLLIQLIAEKLKLGGRIIALLGGVAWAVATMLVIPVLLVEDKGPFEAVRRSAELVKRRWGEGVTGYGSINVALALVFVPLIMAGALLVVVDLALGIAVMGAVILGTMLLIAALGGVFNAALYQYAVAGSAGPFTTPQLESSFVTKEETKRPARRAWRIVGLVFAALYLVVKLLQAADVIPG